MGRFPSTPAARLRADVWQSIFTRDIDRYVRGLHQRMSDVRTLILGPTGTGKELVHRRARDQEQSEKVLQGIVSSFRLQPRSPKERLGLTPSWDAHRPSRLTSAACGSFGRSARKRITRRATSSRSPFAASASIATTSVSAASSPSGNSY
jgi:hypothetical protein